MNDSEKKLLEIFNKEELTKIGVALYAPIKEKLDKKILEDQVRRILPPRVLNLVEFNKGFIEID